MNIDGVNTGYMLDHIEAGKGLAIYSFLKLDQAECTVAIIQRADSTKYGKKDIIKIDGDIPIDCDTLGYMDPNITVNRIKDGKLLEKIHLELPETLTDVIKCRNPRCITSAEQGIEHRFRLTDRKNARYRCIYCDTEYSDLRGNDR